MKKFIKIKPLALLSFLFTNTLLQAQDLDLLTPAQSVFDQVKGIFPLLAGILFLIVCAINLGHFTKEGGDWKKGLINIVVFVIIVGVIVGLFQYITSIQL